MVQSETQLRPLHRRLFHWGPIAAMSIVACIAITSIYCHLQWWPPQQSLLGLVDMLLFMFWNYSVLSNLLQASYIGPGYVPLGWKPTNPEDEQFLQRCEYCGGFKSPRAHHCRLCNRCIMKMDHHCPWINNCTGHRNHGYFVAFLLSAVIGCVHATLILGPSLYWAVFRVWYMYYGTGREPRVELGLYGLFAAIFAFGLAVGVIVAVGFLFCVQMRSILRNQTGIEDYIVAKANNRERDEPFAYPYDLGWKNNLKQVITWDLIPQSNGIEWPVREGCDQYALTREQIELKRIKKSYATEYTTLKMYNGGYWIPRDQGGCGATCGQPFCVPGETRLKLQEGDSVLVTRWRRHWLYGEKRDSSERLLGVADGVQSRPPQRGWFPRKCVVKVANSQAGEAQDGADQGAQVGNEGNPENQVDGGGNPENQIGGENPENQGQENPEFQLEDGENPENPVGVAQPAANDDGNLDGVRLRAVRSGQVNVA